MSCEITDGYNIPCRTIGGIQEIYIGNFIGNQIAYSFASDDPTNVFTFTDIQAFFIGPTAYSMYYTQPNGLDITTQVGDIITISSSVAYFHGTASVLLSSLSTGTGIVTDQIYDTSGGVAVGSYTNTNADTNSGYPNNTIIDVFKPDDYQMFTFPQPREVAQLESTGIFSEENNTAYYSNIISMNFYELQQENFELFNLLAKGVFMIMVLDNTGKYFIFGYDNGCRCIAETIQTGKTYGDLNGAIVQFENKGAKLATQISTEAALELLTVITPPPPDPLILEEVLYPDFNVFLLPSFGINSTLQFLQSGQFFHLNTLAAGYYNVNEVYGDSFNDYVINYPTFNGVVYAVIGSPLQNNPVIPVQYNITGTSSNYLLWGSLNNTGTIQTTIRCEDILSNRATYNPFNLVDLQSKTLTRSMIAEINDITTSTASSTEIVVRIHRAHLAIPAFGPLSPYTDFQMSWETFGLTYSVDPMDNDTMFLTLNTPGYYTVGVRTLYKNNGIVTSYVFPQSYREMVFQIKAT